MKQYLNKKTLLNLLCVLLAGATVVTLVIGNARSSTRSADAFSDDLKPGDLNTILLEDSRVEVKFSDVLLSDQKETRKLIVSEQEGIVSTELTDRIIKQLDFDFLKKTQRVTYRGTGYFVVDLDTLDENCIVQDPAAKTVTILIDHARLEAIEINPNNIIIADVQESLFARGDIEMSVSDYNTLEKELRTRLEERFNTAANGQKADSIALEMVQKIYEPIVKAIDHQYQVVVKFR